MAIKHRLLGGLLMLLCLPALAAPNIQHWRTTNGARVYFVHAPELPMVDVQVTFDAAGARDGDRPGLARLTNGLLAEGAAGLSADRIAQTFADLGARFENSSLRDMSVVSLRSLSDADKLGPALALTTDILAHPDFPSDALERVRGQMLIGLRYQQQSPAKLASREFYAGLYRGHPYASPPEGTPESVKALTRDQVRAFHARHYVAANAVVAIVGDLDRAAAEALALGLMDGLPAGEPAPPLPPAAALQEASRKTLAHPSTQTHLLLGQPGIARLDPDYYALTLANHVFGGSGLVSRLSEEVRERRGLSYSVYSQLQPMRAAGPFIVGLQTRNDQAGEAVAVVKAMLRRFVAEGPTDEELTAAKQNITGGFPLRIDSNAKIVEYLAMIGFYGLPLDYLARYNARILAVTPEEVRDALSRRIDPTRMFTVLVGRPGGLAAAGPSRASGSASAH